MPNETLPSEVGKSDQVLPARFDLLRTQGPVREQGQRGTCSVFAAVAVAEHFERKMNNVAAVDLSEQFLYWLTKEHGSSAPTFAGVAIRDALTELSEGGVPQEAYWPYELWDWSQSEMEGCPAATLQDVAPSYCRTCGQPSLQTLDAPRYYVGAVHSIRTEPMEIKSYLAAHGDPVVVGVATIPTLWGAYSTPNGSRGYIALPSDEASAVADSAHAIVIVGWDDNIQIPRVNMDAEIELDSEGRAIVDRGAFLFRNSWGDDWAPENPMRAGYGYLSYRYAEHFVETAQVADPLPAFGRQELCSNGIDDDRNGRSDCLDLACVLAAECIEANTSRAAFFGPLAIPDENSQGVSIPLDVDEDGPIESVSVAVRITHPHAGDIGIVLRPPWPSPLRSTLRSVSDSDEMVIDQTFAVHGLTSIDSRGTWELRISDAIGGNTGVVQSVVLSITRCNSGACASDDHGEHVYRASERVAIPDDSAEGARATIDVPGGGALSWPSSVFFSVTHARASDVQLVLEHDGCESVVLAAPGGLASLQDVEVPVPFEFFACNPIGAWHLLAYDTRAAVEGEISAFELRLHRH